jgi:hypothetical protein
MPAVVAKLTMSIMFCTASNLTQCDETQNKAIGLRKAKIKNNTLCSHSDVLLRFISVLV